MVPEDGTTNPFGKELLYIKGVDAVGFAHPLIYEHTCFGGDKKRLTLRSQFNASLDLYDDL